MSSIAAMFTKMQLEEMSKEKRVAILTDRGEQGRLYRASARIRRLAMDPRVGYTVGYDGLMCPTNRNEFFLDCNPIVPPTAITTVIHLSVSTCPPDITFTIPDEDHDRVRDPIHLPFETSQSFLPTRSSTIVQAADPVHELALLIAKGLKNGGKAVRFEKQKGKGDCRVGSERLGEDYFAGGMSASAGLLENGVLKSAEAAKATDTPNSSPDLTPPTTPTFNGFSRTFHPNAASSSFIQGVPVKKMGFQLNYRKLTPSWI